MANLNMIFKDIKRLIKRAPQTADISTSDFTAAPNVIILPADIKKLNEILSYLKNDMQQKHLTPKAQFNMITASEEIFSNIALYAYNINEKAVVTIKTELIDNLYSITFCDAGKKFNPLKNTMPDISQDIKDRDIGGLGVFLAKKLTDNQEYTYRNKQNILKISIDINKN